MRIDSLHVRKYKSITQEFVLDEPGKLHIFIGPNNSGKTNILDAISQLYQVNPGRLRYTKTDLTMKFSLFGKSKRELVVNQKGATKKYTLNGKALDAAKAKKFLEQRIIRISAIHEHDTARLQKEYQEFKKSYPHRFQAFVESIEIHFPKIKIGNDYFKHSVVHEDEEERSFERLGEGFKQIFIVLMYLYHPRYTILLLEEPEIHLHPGLVKRLFQVIEEETEENQIFLTTHSPLFIKSNSLHRVFRVSKYGYSTRVHSPRLARKRLNYVRLRQELNADNLEMFFADVVLLVEGPSDHILMRALIDKFYFGDKDVKVIQTYGKSNVDIYTSVLEMFNVRYLVLLDRDALYDTGIKLLDSNIQQQYTQPEHSLIKMLKKHNIYILPNGSIERNYPRKYQRRQKHKPQNAMFAASRITKTEYHSQRMKNLKEVIDAIDG